MTSLTPAELAKSRQQLLEEHYQRANQVLDTFKTDKDIKEKILSLWLAITIHHIEPLLPGSGKLLGPIVKKIIDIELAERNIVFDTNGVKVTNKDGVSSKRTEPTPNANTPKITSFGKGPRKN